MNSIEFRTLAFTVLVFINSFFFSASGQTQSSCPNSNFNLGNFINWEGYYGSFWDPTMFKGFALTRHTIIQSPVLNDPNTCNELNPVPPGEKYSLRLGNESIGAQAEQIRYSVNVTEETSLFIYKYAVVLENPDHSPEEQPSFTIEVADISGNLIDSACGYYYVYAHKGMPSWHSCGDVVWKDWTPVGIDLTKYIGQTVSIKFTTRDCSENGHFGYAYLSAYCSKLQIVFGYCLNDTVTTVTAPPGFSYLWANGDTTQSTIIYNPFYGMIDSCELTSANGCKVTLKGAFEPTIVNADFVYHRNCTGMPTQFYDSSTTNQNIITNWVWDFGDNSSIVTNIQNPQHVYASGGSFYATLMAYSTEGCQDTVVKMIEVIPFPEVDFTTSDACGNKTSIDTIYFDQQVQLEVKQGYDHYMWNTGDSLYSIPVQKEGWYKVTIQNEGICSSTDSVFMMYCNVSILMPNAFTPNDDGLNDIFRPVTQSEKITPFSMLIFDQWGVNIFETQDIHQGWDGTIEGKPAPLGMYVYTIVYENLYGETKKMAGTVILVR
jgi:gliding motility-associated-like protein